MNVLIVSIIVALVAGLLLALKQRSGQGAFESRDILFTPAERSFLGVIEQALDGRYRVFGKVRLGDLVKPAQGLDAGRRTAAQNRINQKHVDFVVCTANKLAVVGVLELDDQSHRRGDRSRRDEFVDQALAMAGIPVLRFSAQIGYVVQDVRARLTEMLAGSKPIVVSVTEKDIGQANPVLDAIIESIPVHTDIGSPLCPTCSAAMVRRRAVKGSNAGASFWACSTFPRCRQVVEVEE